MVIPEDCPEKFAEKSGDQLSRPLQASVTFPALRIDCVYLCFGLDFGLNQAEHSQLELQGTAV